MFKGYEIDGVLQQEPPEWLRDKITEVLAEEFDCVIADDEDKSR